LQEEKPIEMITAMAAPNTNFFILIVLVWFIDAALAAVWFNYAC